MFVCWCVCLCVCSARNKDQKLHGCPFFNRGIFYMHLIAVLLKVWPIELGANAEVSQKMANTLTAISSFVCEFEEEYVCVYARVRV